MKAEREAMVHAEQDTGLHVKAAGAKAWLREVNKAMKANWFLFCYMVVLMAGFNSCSHGSQDLYPTFLKDRKCLAVFEDPHADQKQKSDSMPLMLRWSVWLVKSEQLSAEPQWATSAASLDEDLP